MQFYKISSGKKGHYVNFDDSKGLYQYGKSKLAQVMYGKHLARMLQEQKCNTIVASLHPGFVRTDIFQTLSTKLKILSIVGSYVFGKSPFQGAQTTVHLASCNFPQPMTEISGKFFSDCRSKNWFDFCLPKMIEDPEACKNVWDETVRLLEL